MINNNSNFYQAISPTGRNIQGIVPNKQYFILKDIFNENNKGKVILTIPVPYRKTLTGGLQNELFLLIAQDSEGNTNIVINNKSDYKLNYACSVVQLFDSSLTGIYRQVDSSATTVNAHAQSNKSLISLSKIGDNNGNDSGTIELSIVIEKLTINAIIKWHTPLRELMGDAWLSIETIDKFTDSI